MTGLETASPMSVRESQELATRVRRQATLAKSMAGVRAAELLADFEHQLARDYAWDERETWSKAKAVVELAASRANADIAEACLRLGIPKTFAPSLGYGWFERGEEALHRRRVELRAVAERRIDALAKAAKTEIERRSLGIQTELLAGRLSTEAAQAFLAAMPTAEQLMPSLDIGTIQQQLHSGEVPVTLVDEVFG